MTLFKGIIWLDLFWISLTRGGHFSCTSFPNNGLRRSYRKLKREVIHAPELTNGFNGRTENGEMSLSILHEKK